MIDSFPGGPVLSLSSDAVSQLDAADVLPALWTLFSKCKSSLKEGHRLENISWRLWYREFAAIHYAPPTPESASPTPSEKSTFTPDSQPSISGRSGAGSSPLHDALVSEYVALSPLPRTSPQIDNRYTKSSFSHRSFVRTRYVGKIICDMLSHQIAYPVKYSPAKVSLPTPTSDYFPKITAPATPAIHKTDPLLPAIQLPSTPPNRDRDALCPSLVVVDPTPSPSPHPTPPTTPVVSDVTATSISHGSLSHLLPPPLPLPALTVTAKPPQASSTTVASRPAQLPLLPHQRNSGSADRLFFLSKPLSHSPECEPTSCTPRPSSDRASSTSSSRKAAPTTNNKRHYTAPSRARKGKEVTRNVVRPRIAHNGRPPQIRRTSTSEAKARATFNIGSLSSGSKSAERAQAAQLTKEMAAGVDAVPPMAHLSSVGNPPPGRRRVVVASTSSEYETTDDDDGSSAEDETSVEDVRKTMTKDETKLHEAVLEAKRQREMFAKIPKRSYSSLDPSRSGLLTQLLNPDPSIFPPNHPYHTSFSTQELSKLPRDARTFAQPGTLHTSKSAAALPLAAPVNAQGGSVNTSQNLVFEQKSRGRPAGEEMEDDDSDSGDENLNNAVHVSRSVAQEKLAALVGMQRSNKSSANAVNNLSSVKVAHMLSGPLSRPGLQHVSTAPIPLSHPYNLPAPALPSTPRTTRRQMLQTELSESLRRNLLWERQVSKVNVMARRRKSSDGGSSIGGLRPLTALNGNATTTSQQEQQQPQRPMMRYRSWADDYHSKGW